MAVKKIPLSDTKKPWYLSKTLWVNIIAFAVLLIQVNTGFVISPEEQAAIIVLVNLILRAVTNKGLTRRK
jgi:hypothetical protein